MIIDPEVRAAQEATRPDFPTVLAKIKPHVTVPVRVFRDTL